MKFLAVALSLVTLLSAGCSKKKSAVPPDGTYTGTFSRWPMAAASQVTITFKDGKFSGSSQIDKYPSICQGSFTVSDKSINFLDNCNWLTDFDMTYILSGDYQFSSDGKTLHITRHYTEIKYDEYKLTRQN
ncbi:MAG: hypothetical protein ACTHMC_00060 [Pseudobacter sp.]|uniref:hypothetical protein n=1 Tax=Pseudobacter sp. TaxID=2045420 RepID=UPI003F7D2C8E